MYSKEETGKNLATAFQVGLSTYRNVDKLMRELDGLAPSFGFSSISPRFLRYRSDNDIPGWFITDFIKLYMLNEESTEASLFAGPVYGIEISLNHYKTPKIMAAKYFYSDDGGPRSFSVSPADHGKYNHPISDERNFPIHTTKLDEKWVCRKPTSVSNWYNRLEYVVYTQFELTDIQTADDAKQYLFGALTGLTNIERSHL